MGIPPRDASDSSGRGNSYIAVATCLTICTFVLYFLLKSNVFNGDGLGYARIVEQADSGKLFSVSARVLFCPIGRAVWLVAKSIGIETRAVYVLQFINSLFGALAVGVMYAAVYCITKSTRAGILASAGLAASQAVWFWSTNATSYPGNVFFLTLTLAFLVNSTHIRNTGSYIIIGFLVGIAFGLANMFWLTSLLLIPAVAVSILVGSRYTSIRDRLKALAAYIFAVILFLLIPLLIAAFGTGGIDSLSGFPRWLTAASYGIPPEASLLNVSRGIIGFSSAIVHLDQIGPVIKQLVWGVPFAMESKPLLYLESVAFCMVWAFLLMLLVVTVRNWKAITSRYGRVFITLAAWMASPAVFGLVWLGSDTERWLAVLPALWMTIALITHSASGKRPVMWISSLFVVFMLVYNMSTSAIPAADRANNPYFAAARQISENMKPGDLVLIWGHDNVFTADHLVYFWGLDALHIGQLGREQPDNAFEILTKEIMSKFASGNSVYASGRIFLNEDLPQSHVSVDEANIKREEFREFLSQWDKVQAFTVGTDVFWRIQPRESRSSSNNPESP
jgi:hypothetical protein